MQPACNAVASLRASLARPSSSILRSSFLASAMLGLSFLAACGGGKAPSGLTYANSSAVFTLGTPVNDAPTITGAVVSWDITPALPAGLGLDSGTGVISGTPTAITPQATYTVTATNKDGKVSGTLSITVNDAAPAGLAYESPSVFTKGTAKTLTPKSTGGAVTTFSVAPALPAGLALDAKTGAISGTATTPTPQKNYVVTATNITGSATATVSIVVNDAAPASLAYPGTPFLFTKGTAIAAVSPATTGGVVTSYTVNPALPGGLTIDAVTGVLSGTPANVSPDGTYTVTATNVSGLITATISLSVRDSAPAGLTYAGSPAIYTVLVGAAPLTPSSIGGNILSYSISPELPPGLSFNTATGVIFGTPLVLAPQVSYTVTATNGTGSTTASVLIAVIDVPLGSLSYPAASVLLTRGSSAAPLSPTVSGGGAVTGFTVAPALPAGLTIDAASGVFSGTPTAVSAQASYVISANNSGGSATTTLVITVKDTAPAGLFYPTGENSYVFVKGQASTTGLPTSTGGAIVSYSVSPALPAGLSLNTATGEISGTPTTLSLRATYTVTGMNTGGTSTAGVAITVRDVAPSALTYPNATLVFTVGQAIAPQTPSNAGGAVVSYSVSPALPAGLALDGATGILSGTPTTITASAAYTVTAVNTGGSTTAIFSITVNDAAPTALTYGNTALVTTVGVFTTPDAPTSTGGAVLSYSVAPALPAGLSLDAKTGIISGTATATSAKADYVVTATNSGGSTTATVSITVNPAAPANLTYSQNPATYPLNAAITPNTPASTGGAVASYAVAPALPAGLALDAATGIISGTPTVQTAQATYVVTATNVTNSTTANLVITVGTPPTFTVQPANTTVAVGAAATFSATATAVPGNDPVSYQWLKNGTAIAGATLASYTTPATVAGDDGTVFTVTASDVTGAFATSQPATLTVLTGTIGPGPAMDAARSGHVAVTLKDGRTFFAGDLSASTPPSIFDPATGKFTAVVAALITPRYNAVATLLGNGKVLIVGGSNPNDGTAVTTAEIFDPATGIIAATGSPSVSRYGSALVTLANGNVLAAGDNNQDNTAEIYDQTAGTWSAAGNTMGAGRVFASALLLPNGKVLVVGGGPAAVDLFDPSTGLFTALAPLSIDRYTAAATLLQDGRVLVVGGLSGLTATQLDTAEIYDPTGAGTTTVVASKMSSPRYFFFTATTLQNGKVLVAGGQDAANVVVAPVDLFDPVTSAFTSPGALATPRFAHTATLLPNGKLLIAGGSDAGGLPLNSTELFQ